VRGSTHVDGKRGMRRWFPERKLEVMDDVLESEGRKQKSRGGKRIGDRPGRRHT